MRVLDLFAGPGGWSEGVAALGMDEVGVEWDMDACRTRRAAGHATIRADVARYPPEVFGGRVDGLIASPPCTSFSRAGKGSGCDEIDALHQAVDACRDGWTHRRHDWSDATTPLVLEPLRWVWAIRPTWVACEQVPPVLGLWQHMADVLRDWGYSATAVKLHAEQYGVPQSRTRAFLLAHVDEVRVPRPTHQRYRFGEGQGEAQECEDTLFGPGLKPWISMAGALGWVDESGVHMTRRWRLDRRQNGAPEIDPEHRPCPTVVGSSLAKSTWALRGNNSVCGEGRAERDLHEPSLTVGGRADLWSLRMSNRANATVRQADEPGGTLHFGNSLNEVRWVWERPAKTVHGTFSPEIQTRPGSHVDGKLTAGSDEDSVRIQPHEAAVLQGFRPDYPFWGSKTSVFRQVGNAVPPPLAQRVIGALAGLEAHEPTEGGA